jgi:TonB family protein
MTRIRFTIDANGDATATEVLRSGGSRRLDQATIDALIQCKFKARIKDGQPVESYQELDYIWKLL